MAESSKAAAETSPVELDDSGSKVTTNPCPREIPAAAYDEVDSSFLNSMFGGDRNCRSSNNSTLHRSTLSKSTIRYSKQTSDEDLEARRAVLVTPISQGRAQAMGAGQRFLNNLRASNWRITAEERVNDSSDQGIHMYRMQAATSTNAGFCRVSFIC
jgi:hypothetical protein